MNECGYQSQTSETGLVFQCVMSEQRNRRNIYES